MYVDHSTGLATDDGAQVLNGRAEGALGERLQGYHWDPGYHRPFVDERGERCVRVRTGRTVFNTRTNSYEPERRKCRIADLQARGVNNPVWNASSLRKEEWIRLESMVHMAFRERLKAWADLSASASLSGFNAMAFATVEHEVENDPGIVQVDMSGLTPARQDSPLLELRSTPLPITHSDFTFDERRLMIARNKGQPLDTRMAERAVRRVAEYIEKQVIGLVTGLSYGYQSAGVTAHDSTYKSQVYGYTTFPGRNTYTSVTAPDGTNPDATVADVLAMRDLLLADRRYGPYMLYHSNDWDQYMDNDYYTGTAAQGLASPSGTLRDRLRRIEGIQDVRRLDLWTPTSAFQLLLVQMSSETARAINGLDVTTIQWESHGGMQQNFKVLCICVPEIFADYEDRCGICHGTTA